MDAARPADEDQTTLWNGSAGRAWVDAQETLDQMFAPIEDLLVEAVIAESGRRVLDVGCGTGATTLAVARRIGAAGRCVGIDISAPMIDAARTRAERDGTPATFLRGDVQTYAFEPASFDVILSRFGVMFFDDPALAFANLRRATADEGAIHFVAWRSPAENPFMTAAERAAAPLLPSIPPRRANAPGQFAFADAKRVHGILEDAGWGGIEIRPLDIGCTFPEVDLVRYVTRLGPLGRALQAANDETRARILEAVRPAFDPFVNGAEVRFTAACWNVTARARSAAAR